MKSPYVNELKPNQLVETSFLVQSKEIRQKKGGELYLSLFLADRTGELDAKMWDNVSDVLNEFERDDFVKVKGIIQVFHNKPQMTIHRVRRMDESEVQFTDYFPSSKRDSGEMWLELRAIVAAMAAAGARAMMLFVIQIGSAERFSLARDIDPGYGAAFDRARKMGVGAAAWTCAISRESIEIAAPIPIAG